MDNNKINECSVTPLMIRTEIADAIEFRDIDVALSDVDIEAIAEAASVTLINDSRYQEALLAAMDGAIRARIACGR
jgi:hypothetical protein